MRALDAVERENAALRERIAEREHGNRWGGFHGS